MLGQIKDRMRFGVIRVHAFVAATSQHLTQSNAEILRPAKCRDILWGIFSFCVLMIAFAF